MAETIRIQDISRSDRVDGQTMLTQAEVALGLLGGLPDGLSGPTQYEGGSDEIEAELISTPIRKGKVKPCPGCP